MKKPKKQPLYVYLAAILFLLTILVIWGFSFVPFSDSVAQSGNFYRFIKPFADAVLGKGWLTLANVRKVAHFCEYFFLGVFSYVFIWLVLKQKQHTSKMQVFKSILYSLIVCLTIACIDEALQNFTGRHPQILDILIDFCGSATGVILLAFVFGIIMIIIKWAKNKNNT